MGVPFGEGNRRFGSAVEQILLVEAETERRWGKVESPHEGGRR